MNHRSRLRERHESLGAEWSSTAGGQLPASYGDVAAEWEHVRRRVGLLDLSDRGILRVAGRDRRTWLHGMVTNEIRELADGRGVYAAILSLQGRMLTDLRIYAVEDALLLELPPGTQERIAETLDHYLVMEKVEIQDASAEIGVLSVQGPKAPAIAAALGVDLAALPPQGIGSVAWGREPAWIARVERAGEPGFDLWLPSEAIESGWDRLLEHVRQAGGGPVGLEALDILRVEAGIPWWGKELTESIVPFEARLESAISLTKGCYIGQEIIARIVARGQVNNLLVGLSVGLTDPPPPGSAIAAAGKSVGRVTSAVRSPALGESIALGFLRREHSAPGTEVTLLTNGGEVKGRVVELPFLKGENANDQPRT